MAGEINNGGPAFPTENAMQTGPSSCRYEGMTLRDYFAAKAMQGLVENKMRGILAYGNELEMAKKAYEIADAMLKARDGQ